MNEAQVFAILKPLGPEEGEGVQLGSGITEKWTFRTRWKVIYITIKYEWNGANHVVQCKGYR